MRIKLFGGPSDGHIHHDGILPHQVYTTDRPSPQFALTFVERVDVSSIPQRPIHRYDVLPFTGIAKAMGIGAAVYALDMVEQRSTAFRRAVRWLRSEAWRELNALSIERASLAARIDTLQDALRDSDPDYRPDLRPVEKAAS